MKQRSDGIKGEENSFEKRRVEELFLERLIPRPHEGLVGSSSKMSEINKRASEEALEKAIDDHRLQSAGVGVGEEEPGLETVVRLPEREESLDAWERAEAQEVVAHESPEIRLFVEAAS